MCMDEVFAVRQVCVKYLSNGKMYFGRRRIFKVLFERYILGFATGAILETIYKCILIYVYYLFSKFFPYLLVCVDIILCVSETLSSI